MFNQVDATAPFKTPAEARAYVAYFCTQLVPGTTYVDTTERRIELNAMTDADALFVARELQSVYAEAARRWKEERRP